MNQDWKNTLSALRNELPSPDPSSEINNNETEEKILQKAPLRIAIDKKGRNGKVATIIEGFQLPEDQIEEISRKLKQSLGVGGSTRASEILIQGSHREAVKKFLEKLNFKVF